MSWLTPIGFLGLIGLIVLLIIYLIKPNFQQKFISSTFVWKLSLKYKKKKLPVNKLRNILILICQVLIITIVAMILAQPVIAAERKKDISERVIIIDASASMLTESQSVTRFERGVEKVRELANQTIDEGGIISIILASEKAMFITQEAGSDSRISINADLDSLGDLKTENPCTYGGGDIEGAIALAETITADREGVELIIVTDTNYTDSGRIRIEDVSEELEWNAAILDVRAINFENCYRFEVDVACYGNTDQDIVLFFDIKNANGAGKDINIQTKVRCLSGEVTTFVCANRDKYSDEIIDEDVDVYTYESLTARVEVNDSFEYDNTYFLYGGTKQPLKIQYCSPLPNNFFKSALMVARDQFGDSWDIDVNEVDVLDDAKSEGFDIYIYEHEIPKTLPSDGIVILSDPDYVPSNTGLKIASPTRCEETTLTALEPHTLMGGITASNITLTAYTPVIQYEGYTALMGVGNIPVVLAKNEPHQKIVMMSFSLHYSNLPVILDFPLLISNILDYYAPPTITDYVYDVNSTVSLNSRSESMLLVGPSTHINIKEFPASVTLSTPGVYTATQRLVSGQELVDTFFVRVPMEESNTEKTEDSVKNPIFAEKVEINDFNLVVYFALLMAALLFAEWWLHTREQF